MKRKSVSVEPEKVHRLTLAELAAHDDACSDAMIDNVCEGDSVMYSVIDFSPGIFQVTNPKEQDQILSNAYQGR